MRQRLIILLMIFSLPLIVAVAQPPSPIVRPLLRPQASALAYQPEACTALVETALAQVGNNCGGIVRNEACYGFNRVDATFVEAVDVDVFAEPADRAELLALTTIQTAPLDLEQNRWGVAVLNVQANLPNTVPGQGVVMLLLGDTQVENRVSTEAAFLAGDAIPVITVNRSNIRSGPSQRNNVVAAVTEGTELAADARNSDGTWVRVVYDGNPGWIFRELISSTEAIDSLPVVTEETRSPMQAFYFSTGVGQTECVQAPDALLIQGPEGVRIDLQINEADISIGSTVLLRTFTDEDGQTFMEILVIDGEAVVNNLVIPAGFTAVVPTGDTEGETTLEGVKTVDGEWTGCQEITPEQREQLLLLEGLPAELLNYLVELPDQAVGICAPPGTANTGGGAGGQSQIAGVDCRNFRPTSPLDGLPFGQTVFYWDPAPGATSYRVLLFDESGAQVASFDTAGAETSLIGDTNFGSGFSYSWSVQALSNGAVACTSQSVTMLRSAPPDTAGSDDAPAGACTVSADCNCNGVCEPTYPQNENNSFCPADCP